MDNSMVAWMLAGGRRAELAERQPQTELVSTRRETDASRIAEGRIASVGLTAPLRAAATSFGSLFGSATGSVATTGIDAECCAA